MANRNVRIVPPEEFSDNIIVTNPKKKAVGIPAIKSSMQHISEEIGMVKGLQLLNKMNQKDGFDCSGCAWPDPKERSSLGEYCENGAKALAEEATTKLVTPDFFKNHSVEEMSNWTDFKIGKSGRITHPMYLAEDSSYYRPISWEEAFKKIGDKLIDLEDPNEAIFYTSGRTSNEAAYVYQLFAKRYGTNNLPDCSNMCHESSGSALSKTVGIGKGSVRLADLYEAEVILVMGQNPGTNHPRMLAALEKCKKNGGKVVSVNPIPETGTNVFVDPQNPIAILKGGTVISDLYLQVKINEDLSLLKAVMVKLLEEEEAAPGTIFDLDFIENKTEAYIELVSSLKEYSFDELVARTGIETTKVLELVDLLKHKKKIIICWAMGITQHTSGVANIQEIVNLLLLKGAIGIPGAGTCPVRGHSNVQGDRTMGIYEKPSDEFLDKLDHHYNIKSPRAHGHDVVESIQAMHDKKIKVFMSMGGNFISATPDSEKTGKAMQNCDLTIQVSTKLNRAHLVTGKEALILPCIARSEKDIQAEGEQFVSIENSMGIVHSSQGVFPPKSEHLKSEVAIVCDMALATFGKGNIPWQSFKNDYDNIRADVSKVVSGFEDFNKKVRNPNGFELSNCARDSSFSSIGGSAKFTINELPDNSVKDGHLILMTIRTHDQYNTTIYGMDDRYRGIYNERRVLLMNKSDMKLKGLEKLDVVNIYSHWKDGERKALNFKVLPYDIAKGCVATYFPEANVLVPLQHTAKISNTPVSKFIEVSLEKV